MTQPAAGTQVCANLPPDLLQQALERVGQLVALEDYDGDWADRTWALLHSWAESDGLPVQIATHGGCRYLVVAQRAAQPAFSADQRQGLFVTARLVPQRVQAGGTPIGRVIARGAWFAVQALTLASAFKADRDAEQTPATPQQAPSQQTARDLTVTIELEDAGLRGQDDNTEALLAPLGRSAFAVAEWGGWPLVTKKQRVLPVVVGQKGRLLVRIAARGEADDAALPGKNTASDKLRQALDRVDAIARPWRKTAAAKAFVTAMASVSGLGKGLAWRALLSSGAWNRTLSRFPTANRLLIDTLFHDTTSVTQISSRGSGGGSEAEAVVDCRLLPGSDTATLLQQLGTAVGDDVEVVVLRDRPASESPLHTPLLRSLVAAVHEHDPTATPVPMLMPGTCDALGWRQAAIPCYGFSPIDLSPDQDALRHWHNGGLVATASQQQWGLCLFVEALMGFCIHG